MPPATSRSAAGVGVDRISPSRSHLPLQITPPHTQIMASGCVPLFLDLGRLPAQTLALYPRAHLAAALRLPGLAISPSATSPSATSPSIAAPADGGGERDVEWYHQVGAEWYLHPAAFALDAAALRTSLSPSSSTSTSTSTSTGARPRAAAPLAPSASRAPSYWRGPGASYWRLAASLLAHARRHLSSSAMAAHVTLADLTLTLTTTTTTTLTLSLALTRT